jgi:phospholipase/carboxylesterase
LLLLLHGVRSNEEDLIGLAPLLDPRFHVVSMRAPLTLGPSAYGWFPVQFVPGGFLIDENVAEQSRKQVIDFTSDAVEKYGTDPDRVYLMGFSQGAIMSLASALTQPDLYAGVVAMSGRFLPQIEPIIAPAHDLKGLPITVVHGTYDEVIPVEFGRTIKEKLEKLPVDLTYREYPMGHHVSQESMRDVSKWLTSALDDPRRL